MKKLLIPLLFATTLLAHSQTIYTIPWASQQPKFVFPVFFEEAGGQKDTIYLGFDSLADGSNMFNYPNADTIYGVKRIQIDTTKFYACWENDLYSSNGANLKDTVYKANVSSLVPWFGQGYFPYSKSIRLNKGILPLKISWDKSMFYSDSLPFLSHNTAPKAEARITIDWFPDFYISENGYFNYNYFSFYNTLLSDTIVASQSTVRDSLTLSNYFGFQIPVNTGSFEFYIQEWTGINTSLYEKEYFGFTVYPNPFNSYFNIDFESNLAVPFKIKVFDLYGHLIYSKTELSGMDNSLYRINMNHIMNGFYLLEISIDNLTYRKIIIKL